MIITLIGMSGVGKSHTAKKLEKKGFKRYSADEFIESKLEKVLRSYKYSGLADISKWMGQPYDDRYINRSKRYMDLENKSMKEIIRLAKSADPDEKIIIDSTGSIIYTDESVLVELMEISHLIYMETSADAEKEMFKTYIHDPKPVIWGGAFSKEAKETGMEALARSYPKLLEERKTKYQALSTTTVHYKKFRNMSAHQLNDYILNLKNNEHPTQMRIL